MSRRVRLFLFLSGFWIFFAWGFRLVVLYRRWGTDPSWARALVLASFYFLVGGFLISLGRLGSQANRRHYVALIVSSLFIIGHWTVKLLTLALYPDIDPNPRSHLHLAATFLVMGILLLGMGVKGRRNAIVSS